MSSRSTAAVASLTAALLLIGEPFATSADPAPQVGSRLVPTKAHSVRPADVPSRANLPPLDAATSLLVVAPHPDDESLCCAGAIQRVLQAGGRASIVWVTNGDGSELDLLVVEKSLFVRPEKLRDLARRRMLEARTAARILGVPPEQQFFLGYPDRGVLKLITDNYATPYHSRFTGATTVPYEWALSPGKPYTGDSLESDFNTVLERVKPTLVLAPSPQDAHPDHRAAGIMTLRAMSGRDELSRVRYWIIHGGEGWPSPRGLNAGLPLLPSPRGRGLDPAAFTLDDKEEQRKLEAIRAYHTQMEVMSSYLLAFVRTTELYSSTPVREKP